MAGTIRFRGIIGDAVAELGERIVGGDWAPGEALPREADLIEIMGVGRSVVRESLRILTAKGLVRSRTSDGTRVMPREEWRLLDPDVMHWRIQSGDHDALLTDLFNVRLAMEPGLVRLATQRADQTARSRIRKAWDAMQLACEGNAGDEVARRQDFVEADLEYHRAFLAATGSPLLNQLFSVIEAALTLLFELQIRNHGNEAGISGLEASRDLHARVYTHFEAGDAEGAERAMLYLIEQAVLDARRGLGHGNI